MCDAASYILPRNIVLLVVLFLRSQNLDFLHDDNDLGAVRTILRLPAVLAHAPGYSDFLPFEQIVRKTLRALSEQDAIEEARVGLLVLAELVHRDAELDERGFPGFLLRAIPREVSADDYVVDVSHYVTFLDDVRQFPFELFQIRIPYCRVTT